MTPLSVDDIRIEDPDFYFAGRRDSYERLHAECPVFYYEPLDILVLTKHEDIRQAARRPDIFSSAHGLHLHQLRLTPEEVALMWRTAPPRMPLDPEDEMRRALTIADYQQALP